MSRTQHGACWKTANCLCEESGNRRTTRQSLSEGIAPVGGRPPGLPSNPHQKRSSAFRSPPEADRETRVKINDDKQYNPVGEYTMNIPEDVYTKLEALITSDTSPVGIDAKKTHILILHKLTEIERKLDSLIANQ